jgi:hypothetical protein
LAAFSRAKISAVADTLHLDPRVMRNVLETEIRSGRLPFKIDEDEDCVIKNQNYDVTYLAVLSRACRMINSKNNRLTTKFMNDRIIQDAQTTKLGDIMSGFIG